MTTEHKGNCSWLTDGDDACPCDLCTWAREDFAKWCDTFNIRWEAHRRANAELAAELETIRASQHTDCGPLCTVHGDVRDHSAVR